MCNEMIKLRKMLNDEGIEWSDVSCLYFLTINRTHFEHRKSITGLLLMATGRMEETKGCWS